MDRRERFLSVMCCAIKGKDIMLVAMNCQPIGTVGWVVAQGTVGFGSFCSLNSEG